MKKFRKKFSYNKTTKCATLQIKCKEKQKEAIKDILSDPIYVNHLLKLACKKYNLNYDEIEKFQIFLHVKN